MSLNAAIFVHFPEDDVLSCVLIQSSIGEDSEYSEDADSFQEALLNEDHKGEEDAAPSKDKEGREAEAVTSSDEHLDGNTSLEERSLEPSVDESIAEAYVASKNRPKTRNQDLPAVILHQHSRN